MAEKMELNEVEVWDGNMAASQALRQAQIDVVAAYPITPSTPIVQNYSSFLANGYIDGEFVMVESEHAAMSGCVGAAAAGGRVATATSSQGFALMSEVLYQASGMRLPIVLAVVNRALAAPLNVNGDHSDMYLGRDSGWIQLDAYNSQQAYDLTLMAFRIGEDHEIRLPVMVHQDGFITSHTAENVHPLSDDEAYEFVGEYKPMNAMLDLSKPVTYGVQTEEDWHFEHKARQHADLMTKVFGKVEEVFDAFEKKTGRKYNIVEEYLMEDAEVAIVALGTTVETATMVANMMREEGIKAGVVSPRLIRPWPYEQIKKALSKVKAVACLDRSSPNGALGMLYNEVTASLYQGENHPVISNYIYGLGGRDFTIDHAKEIYKELDANAKEGKLTTPLQQFVGLRGPKLSFY
ncbi:2-oxoacid:ferredoxin oxidoreductase subunit alpha [Hydrogenimonas thermophila]|uniref:Pyruvate ferredoxin oxidoreductase alpha subunit n=1 Tax=Hydrogenimonas thermophila TaxID=223786 RepID=A0A1I5L7U2_9BACT|nr:2-oxoacid:ferredoxin oxidoreductase subunit alpha [Hydrogenimonas thermophila]WOE70096.1 2-oxoacid:ferredoxin oxidoreductase subunit alpha [Hydrogenimonas thermophila]WOE72613.1 2-oxoacid:ferredoxin oxidoreductase subunit alpha [Hydrogenimonas thermophila]SFO93454.1 pyruvate ferredoxin oxidoreductase alpha subunit [Hydrogenimonas thermophila]